MKLMFEDYRYKYSECPHFITLPSPMSSAEVTLLQNTRGLNVLQYSPKDNHKELTQSLLDMVGQVNTARNRIASEQDW